MSTDLSNAYLLTAFLAPLSGALGYLVVVRNEVFHADTLSHVAYTGAFVGIVLGLQLEHGVLLAIAIAAALFSLSLRVRHADSVTAAIAMTCVLGIGSLFTFLYTTRHSAGSGISLASVAFGSLLSTSQSRAISTALFCTCFAAILGFVLRPLLFCSLDPCGAASARVPARRMRFLFLGLLGFVIALGVQTMGAFLILGLLVIPGTIAASLAVRPVAALAFSACLGYAFAWSGLGLTAVAHSLPPGAAIIGIGALTFACWSVFARRITG